MNIVIIKTRTDLNRRQSLLQLRRNMQVIIKKFVSFFTFSEEEQSKAGIGVQRTNLEKSNESDGGFNLSLLVTRNERS